MDLECRFKDLLNDFDDIQNSQKASEKVVLFLESLNEELYELKYNDVSL